MFALTSRVCPKILSYTVTEMVVLLLFIKLAMELSPYRKDLGFVEDVNRRREQLKWYVLISCLLFLIQLIPAFCLNCSQKCELCPQRDGALKKTDTNGWAHVVCALYIPEVRFGNVSTMEPIMLGLLPPDRWSKSCYICESKGKESKASVGACMQCNKSTCKNYFHVTW